LEAAGWVIAINSVVQEKNKESQILSPHETVGLISLNLIQTFKKRSSGIIKRKAFFFL
jgi:hypothetical protein